MRPEFELDGDVGSAKPAPAVRRWRARVGFLAMTAFSLACALVLITLLVPDVTRCDWPRARRAQCVNNLKQIQLALDDYQQAFGSLPPAYIADAGGRRLHSWRVLILPFLEQGLLYDLYDFREPWDGPNNRKLLGRMPSVYACPSRRSPLRNLASYAVIGGPGTMFPGTTPVEFADVTDGLSDTLMVVETDNMDIPWTAPVDLDVGTVSLGVNDEGPGISSVHSGSANVVFGNGRVRHLPEGIDRKTLRALITIAGGEKIKADEALHDGR